MERTRSGSACECVPRRCSRRRGWPRSRGRRVERKRSRRYRPDAFDRVEFGAVGGQPHQRTASGTRRSLAMCQPAPSAHDGPACPARAWPQTAPGTGSSPRSRRAATPDRTPSGLRLDGGKDVSGLEAAVAASRRTCRASTSDGRCPLLPDPSLVHEEERICRRDGTRRRSLELREPFLRRPAQPWRRAAVEPGGSSASTSPAAHQTRHRRGQHGLAEAGLEKRQSGRVQLAGSPRSGSGPRKMWWTSTACSPSLRRLAGGRAGGRSIPARPRRE